MDHVARARELFEKDYLTPAIDHAVLAMREASGDDLTEMRFIVGASLERKRQRLAALIPLNRILDDNPDHAKALTARGSALRFLLRRAEGRADFERSVQLDPDDTNSWIELACVCHDTQDWEGRDKAMAKLEELDALPGWLSRIRGTQRSSAGDAAGAESDWRAGAEQGDPMSAFQLVDAGKALESGTQLVTWAFDREKRNLAGEAIEAYREGIAKGVADTARDVRVRRRLAKLLVDAGEREQAVQVAVELTDAYADRADAWLARGSIDGESSSYEKAYELSASDAAVGWARHLLETGRKPEALQVCNARLAEDPDDIAAHVLRGEVLLASEQRDEAKQAWLNAETLGDTKATSLRVQAFGRELGRDFFSAGLELLDNRQRDDAAVEFENAVDLLREETKAPGDEAHRYLAKSLYNSAFIREMRVADEIIEPNLREAVELDASYTDAMLALGNLCLRTDRQEEGLGWLLKAGEMDPASGQAWYYRARHNAEHGNHEQAVEDAGKAFTAYSNRGQTSFAADAAMMRGKSNEALGKLFDAKADYENAYEYGHSIGYAMCDNIESAIALAHPDSEEASEVVYKICERIQEGEYPWAQNDVLEARVAKSEKAKALVKKLSDDQELEEEETEWLIGFLEGA